MRYNKHTKYTVCELFQDYVLLDVFEADALDSG